MDNGCLLFRTGPWCKGRLNLADIDLCNIMLPHSMLLIDNKISHFTFYLRMYYTFIVIHYTFNQLSLFIHLFIYSCTCLHLVNLYSRITHVDIINEDLLVRLYYTCKKQPFHLDVNHYVLNKLLIYLFFIRYIMIIKSNPKQTTVCTDPTICLQLMKWLTFMYSYFISRSFYKCIFLILIFKIINLSPISLKLINLMESICISLTYNVLNRFECMKLILSMETKFESFGFKIICPFGSLQNYVSYVSILILFVIEPISALFTIHPKNRYINIVFILRSLIVYPAFIMICVLDYLSNSNYLIMCCGILGVHYTLFVNPHPHLQVQLHLNKMSVFNKEYEYQLYSYINHYSCTINFHTKDRGTSFCCGISMSKCFTHTYICMVYDYITTDGSGSILTGPSSDKYFTKIIYSPIIYKLLVFININTNTRVKLFKSLSDEHGLILCMRPTAFTLTHALFSLSMCVFCNNWWKPVANIISISLITFTKLITQVHSLNLSIGGATLYALLLLSLSFLKVVI